MKEDTPSDKLPDKNKNAVVVAKSTEVESVFKDWANPKALLEYGSMLYKSGLNSFGKPEDVVLVMVWAKELGIPIASALAHSFVVNDKHSVDSHMARALIDRAGIIHETIEDSVPVYQYTSQLKDVYEQEDIDGNPDMFVIFKTVDMIKAAADDIKAGKYGKRIPVLRGSLPYDYRTTIKFTRWSHTPEGYHKKTEYGIFYRSEAENAGLLTKSNWKNWEKDCMYSRAWMRGARRIGDDAMMGVYSRLELTDEGIIDIPFTDVSEL